MKGKRILVLDHVTDVCEMLSMHLEGNGYQSLSKTTWTQAVFHLRQCLPDVIVLGFGLLPEQSCEILQQLDEFMRRSGVAIPVVVMGLLQQNSRDHDVLKNFVAVQVKFRPYETENLALHVEELLRQNDQESQSAA